MPARESDIVAGAFDANTTTQMARHDRQFSVCNAIAKRCSRARLHHTAPAGRGYESSLRTDRPRAETTHRTRHAVERRIGDMGCRELPHAHALFAVPPSRLRHPPERVLCRSELLLNELDATVLGAAGFLAVGGNGRK